MKKFASSVALCLVVLMSHAQDYAPAARKLQTALLAVNMLYVDSVDNEKMVTEAVRAMIKQLDPHSDYMTKEEVDEMNEPLQGGFDGIGISFNMMNDTLFIVEVINGGPSEKTGLLAGDRILRVDGEPIAGVKMSSKEVMKRLKGPKGTKVTVSVKRRNTPGLIDFTITRGKIPMYSLDAAFMVAKTVGYIKLNRFSTTTLDEFLSAVSELKKAGMTQLILDLQSNGGGIMGAAVDLADQFLGDGKCVVYTEGLHSAREQYDATARGAFEAGNLVILIDEYSASSSEIVTGAVQDWDRGLVIGRRSFGKGLVQRPVPLGDGSVLKLTVSRYYTPSGRCIQRPYEGGDQVSYGRDLVERYNRGEMLSADSIHFPDSLKCYTLTQHRTVYGGGGIMPDIFVPVDTSRVTSLHRNLVYKGILNRFTLQYVDDNRAALKQQYPTDDDFVARFEADSTVLEQMFRLAAAEKYEVTEADRASDMSFLKLQVKAYIARDLYQTASFYKVMQVENEALQEAVRVLADRKLKAKYGLK